MSEKTPSWITPRRRIILAVILAVILAALIFHLGMSFEAEHFEFEYGNTSFQGIEGPFSIPIPFPHEFIPNGNGVVGTITSLHWPDIDITNRIGEKQSVLVSSSTVFDGGTTTLAVGEQVIVICHPDQQGRIVAQFIRATQLPDTD